MNDIHIKEPTSNNDRSSGYLGGKREGTKKFSLKEGDRVGMTERFAL